MTARRPATRASTRLGRPWTRWLVTAAGLAAVTLLAFGGGLLAGVLFEEPSLVSSYVLGDATSVEWGAGAAEPPAVAAEPPEVAAEPPEVVAAPPEPTPPPAAAPRPAPTRAEAPRRASEPAALARVEPPAPPAAAPRPGSFAVQVGAFAGEGAAEHLAEALRARGHSVYVVRSGRGAQARWRVRVGPLASRPEAERAATRLRRDEKLPTWILREEAG